MSLQAHDIGVDIGTPKRPLFRALSFRTEIGDMVAVVGPNGAGKSTLLRVLAGLRRPDLGHVALFGHPLERLDRREVARVRAFLPQSTPLYQDLDAIELVALGRAPHVGRLGVIGPRDRDDARRALASVGLSHVAHRRVFSLSGGEYQRVMLARMLAGDAKLLVLDEPTAALDIGHALGFLELCRTLCAAGKMVVVAIHDLELARRYATHAICLTGTSGQASVGRAAEVLVPGVLEPCFGVRVQLTSAGLRFDPRSAPT